MAFFKFQGVILKVKAIAVSLNIGNQKFKILPAKIHI